MTKPSTKSLDTFIGASAYLSGLKQRLQWDKLPNSDDYFALLDSYCQQLEQCDLSDLDAAEQTLIECKARFAFIWSLAELQRIGSPDERGRWQTQFAETSIHFALQCAWLGVARKHRALTAMVEQHHGVVPGLFIFGMGKLGGHDLNFSSDVDLVAYFDPDVLPVPDMLGKSYVCHQVLQALTLLLSQKGQAHFIWRVDWRLRPNASATTLAMSTVAAEDYYFYRASPWHRLALMKARVVAGDIALGHRFLDVLLPFIWRQNLDYRALDELAEIKQRINLEHPSLRTQRQWREPIDQDIAGFNVKLGSGGIREIEFIANALQLVWGGRLYDLRTGHTATALAALITHKRLSGDIAEPLVGHYYFLRRIENAIQIMANQQTHSIPNSEHQQQNLLILLGYGDWSSLVEELNKVRRFVKQHFDDLFAEQAISQEQAIVWPSGLNEQADDIIDAWENGYQVYGVSNQVRHRLRPLTKALANYVSNDSDQQQSDTIVRLHDFFRSLPSGEQYFRLLAESPELLRRFVPPLLYSPPMTLLLTQSPHIIDCYVQQPWSYPQPFDSAYVLKTQDYEQRLERLRRFVNEYLYQLYLAFLQGDMLPEPFQQALTELAEYTMELALKIVAEQMQLDEVPISVIGMGKMGLRRMSPLSDLDLIFVFDPNNVSLDTASRFVSRLQTAVSTPMREGIVYELDTRLRPSGRSGAPTVSIDSFAKHHQERAHTWEHIALVPSRVLDETVFLSGGKANNKRLVEQVDTIKRQVIGTPRDQQQFLHDAVKMWQRITEHRLSDTPAEVMNSKLRYGGLMQAEYLAACLVLQKGRELVNDNSDMAFSALLNACVANTELAELPEIIQFWRIQQLWERLLGKTGASMDSLPHNYLQRLLVHSDVSSLEQLIAKKQRYAELVQQGMAALFADVEMDASAIDDWLESAVEWQ